MSHRLLSLDLIKIVSMFCVICLHTKMYFLENPAAHFLYDSCCCNTDVLYGKWLFVVR